MQVGTIISACPILWNTQWNWSIIFQYSLDAGGTQTAQVFVGTPQQPVTIPLGNAPFATVLPWTSPTSTITVSPNPPGTTNPVTLACPPLIQTALFNVPLK